jgi:hypothetical protein
MAGVLGKQLLPNRKNVIGRFSYAMKGIMQEPDGLSTLLGLGSTVHMRSVEAHRREGPGTDIEPPVNQHRAQNVSHNPQYRNGALMKMNLKLGAIALAMTGLCGAAQANTLTFNQTVAPVDLIAAPGGTLLDSLSSTVTTPTFSGTLRTAVYDGPEAGVNLDFYYQFSNSAGSENSIGRVTGYDFDAWATSVFQTAQAFGIFLAGDTAALSADRDSLGTIGFNMLPDGEAHGKLLPGETSYTFLIRTAATQYMPGWSGVIDGTAGFAPAFQPAVPEPGTNALIAAGLGLMGFVVRRRTKREKMNG